MAEAVFVSSDVTDTIGVRDHNHLYPYPMNNCSRCYIKYHLNRQRLVAVVVLQSVWPLTRIIVNFLLKRPPSSGLFISKIEKMKCLPPFDKRPHAP